MPARLFIFTAISLLFFSGATAGENLIANGSFEKGVKTPDNWEKANGLTSFYVDEEGHGRVVKLDTRVGRDQAVDWMKKFKENPAAPPPAPEFPENELATVAAEEGAWLDSDLIDVKPGQNYKLSVEYKGSGAPIVWIKGFLMNPRRKEYSDGYQTRLVPDNPDPKAWKSYSIGFNPTARSPKVEKMKVRIYAYWPPGIYFFDNVKIEEITQEEMEELVRKRALLPDDGKKPGKD